MTENKGDLISREALKKAYFNAINETSIGEVSIIALIDNAPTVERPQGTWKWIYKEYDYYCSNCGNNALQLEDYPYLSSYCPFCGAKMEREP